MAFRARARFSGRLFEPSRRHGPRSGECVLAADAELGLERSSSVTGSSDKPAGQENPLLALIQALRSHSFSSSRRRSELLAFSQALSSWSSVPRPPASPATRRTFGVRARSGALSEAVTGKTPVHRHHIFLGHTPSLRGDLLDVDRDAGRRPRSAFSLPLDLAQVEEQASSGFAVVPIFTRLHERRMYSWIAALDPPHGIGREAEPACSGSNRFTACIRPTLPFRNDFADGQAVTAIAHSNLGDEAQVAGHQLMRGVAVVMLLVALSEHVLLAWLEHGKFSDFREIVRQSGFAGRNRGQTRAGHDSAPFLAFETPADPAGPPAAPPRARSNLLI